MTMPLLRLRTCAARCGQGQQRQAAHDADSQKPWDVHNCDLNPSAFGNLHNEMCETMICGVELEKHV
jgi:hypothetical protein